MNEQPPKPELVRELLENHSAIGASVWELLQLIHHADSDGNVNASVNTIAGWLGKTRVGVLKNLRRLEQSKLIERQSSTGLAAKYKVRVGGVKTNV